MQTDFQHSESLVSLAPALVKAQAAMGVAIKDADNPYYKSKYVPLEDVIDIWKKPLNDNGLVLLQPVSSGSREERTVREKDETGRQKDPYKEIIGGVRVTTLLLHESGEWISATVDFPADKENSQAYGKAVSYARRYSSMAFLSIPAEDDDAHESTHGNPQRPRPFPKPSFTPLAPQPVAPLQEISANRERQEPVMTTIDEGEIDFYQFSDNNNAIGLVQEVTEVPARTEGKKSHWRFVICTKDQNFTAKMWNEDPSGQGYQNLVDTNCWYRVKAGEWRGQVQYTLEHIEEVTDDNCPK